MGHPPPLARAAAVPMGPSLRLPQLMTQSEEPPGAVATARQRQAGPSARAREAGVPWKR
jgi:hypothetical protein